MVFDRPVPRPLYLQQVMSIPILYIFLFLTHIIFVLPVDLQPENDAAQDTLATQCVSWTSGRDTVPETFYVALDHYLLTVTALFAASEMSVASAL